MSYVPYRQFVRAPQPSAPAPPLGYYLIRQAPPQPLIYQPPPQIFWHIPSPEIYYQPPPRIIEIPRPPERIIYQPPPVIMMRPSSPLRAYVYDCPPYRIG
ncbi:MAG: hypothetical protein QW371_01310 [Candidatus Bathyarchaeia archaeon]